MHRELLRNSEVIERKQYRINSINEIELDIFVHKMF